MASEVQTDERIMGQVACGRADQLELLVRRFATPLLTFIHRLVGDRHLAEELFQETFLAVWTRRAQYQYPRPFRPWLYTIALNRCRAHLRVQRAPAVALDESGLAQPGGQPEASMTQQETAAQVLQAVLRLPPQQRTVVSLRVWEELPYARIAEILDLSEPTVRSHMHHALVALRRDLAALAGEPT
jgi:RNA polymerase sigma-70 factor (ECF subfamily)